ncbi:MAG TPA: hypothetical protein VMS64_19215 [Candidatus Methylomirabilis sp.]|nr:hypothetical protein [Candidatus Methylomirabilis sp.]
MHDDAAVQPITVEELEVLRGVLAPGLSLIDLVNALVAYGRTGPEVEAYNVAARECDDMRDFVEQEPESELATYYVRYEKRQFRTAVQVIVAAIGRPLSEASTPPSDPF